MKENDDLASLQHLKKERSFCIHDSTKIEQQGANFLPLISSKAPAKIILTGEHAAVYGCPVLAASMNRFATTTIYSVTNEKPFHKRRKRDFLSIRLSNLKSHITSTVAVCVGIKERLLSSYKKFITGRKSIKDVLSHPTELFQYALGSFLQACYLEIEHGLDIRVASSIPIGCGMGSSAATIVSFIRALMSHFGIQKGYEWIEKVVLEIERLQHGRSSGIDTHISLHGGAVLYEVHKPPIQLATAAKKHLMQLPLWIITTGRPDSSTGECVQYIQSSEFGTAQHSIWNEARSITYAIHDALQQGNETLLQKLLTCNQQLLCRIGVVPQKVQSFISDAKNLFGSCIKITGAGAIRGECGGVLLGLGTKPSQDLLHRYGYKQCENISLSLQGSEVFCA